MKPRIGENQFGGESVTYEGVGSTKKWERIESYGSKFVENIVQAVSRDIFCNAMKTLRRCFIVGHIHDELIIQCSPEVADTVTKDLSDAWAVQRETEGISSRNIRVSNLRQVAKYLNSIGIESYMPQMLQSGETKIAHVFTADERKEFFESLNKLTFIAGGRLHILFSPYFPMPVYNNIRTCGVNGNEKSTYP